MLRGLSVFELSKMGINVKYKCASDLGVKYWNAISGDLKVCRSSVCFLFCFFKAF